MGVSNKNAQDNIQPKGNKKPLQVLHISKKDSQEINNEQNNSQEDIKKKILQSNLKSLKIIQKKKLRTVMKRLRILIFLNKI